MFDSFDSACDPSDIEISVFIDVLRAARGGELVSVFSHGRHTALRYATIAAKDTRQRFVF